MSTKKVIIINGPNLNLIGKRETTIYGEKSFEEYLNTVKLKFANLEIHYFQSNDEGEIIQQLHIIDCPRHDTNEIKCHLKENTITINII